MALTLTEVNRFVIGDRKMAIYDVLFDASYPIGGEAVTAANFRFDLEITHVFDFVARDPDTADNAFLGTFDKANLKLMLFYSDNNNAADGPLIELPDTTSAAAYTARITLIGK